MRPEPIRERYKLRGDLLSERADRNHCLARGALIAFCFVALCVIAAILALNEDIFSGRDLSFGLSALKAADTGIRGNIRSGGTGYVQAQRFMMDTYVNIKVPLEGDRSQGKSRRGTQGATEEAAYRAAVERAMDQMQEAAGKMDRLAAESDIARLNHEAGSWVQVDPEVAGILRLALKIFDLSGGAFDPTVAPILDLWGFGGQERVPDEVELEETLQLVNGAALELDEGTRRAKLAASGMAVDLGGIAKGYVVDVAIAELESSGITSALVDAGGNIRVLGSRPGGGKWRLGIKHPRKDGVIAILGLDAGMAVATSGDYQRYFVADGVRYHHLMDPRTGWPARGMASATVIAHEAVYADALSTAVFILGPDRGLELLEELPEVEGVIVLEDGSLKVSSGLVRKGSYFELNER